MARRSSRRWSQASAAPVWTRPWSRAMTLLALYALALAALVLPAGASGAAAGPEPGSWSIVPTDDTAGFFNNQLLAVSAASSSDVWAVGYDDSGTFAQHWDGHNWTHVPTPNAGEGSP